MAQRRMFSKRIVESARFLKMPPSTQNLYFHLGLNADDDGVVEGFNIMRQTGASEDDLRVLVSKEFVTVLNDDLVTYINDWRENNKIRADRKVDSIYKDLLIQMIPNIELQHAKARADTGKKAGVKHVKEIGRPVDNQRTTNGPHRLGQSRLGQSRLGKVRSSSSVDEPGNSDKPVDNFDDDDDKKQKLLDEINRIAKKYGSSEPTPSEQSALLALSKKLTWKELRLVVMTFSAKVSNGEVQKPFPYLLTVLNEKVTIKERQ